MGKRGIFSWICVRLYVEHDVFTPRGCWRLHGTFYIRDICKSHYTPHYFVFELSRELVWWWVVPWNLSWQRSGWWVDHGWGYNWVPILQLIRSTILGPSWDLGFRSASCVFDIVATISDVFLRLFSLWSVIRMLKGMYWGVILYAKTNFNVSWFSLYKFYGGLIL